MLSKSKIKKVKTKKATIKKAKPSTTSEDIMDNEEKENVDSSRRTSESNDTSSERPNKMEDVKTNRKRPLEDIDVEGQSFFSKFLSLKCLVCLTLLIGLSVTVTAILLILFV